jgi:hypothetical protein
MRRGLHASPVAYKREGNNVKGTALRPKRASIRHAAVTVEVCTDCGSDRIERHGAAAHCKACQVVYLLAEHEAPRRKVGTVATDVTKVQHCRVSSCRKPIKPGQFYYAQRALGPDDAVVTLHYCERHAPYAGGTSRAYRREQSCERRNKPHGKRVASQKRLGKSARHKDRAPRRKDQWPRHDHAVKRARASGWAKVGGVWTKVV